MAKRTVPSRRQSGELFPTDTPIPAGSLIGREGDIDRFAHQIRQRINLVLPGPRRTGKTSVCLAAVEEVRDDDLYVVHLDLRKVSDIGQMAEAIVVKVFENRPILDRAAHHARETGRTLLESIAATASANLALFTGDPSWDFLSLAFTADLRKDPQKHLDYALGLPEKVAAADGKRCLVFLDEFQDVWDLGELEREEGGKRLLRKMRGYFDESPSCRYLFAGSKEHMLRDIFSKGASPFFNFGSFERLEPIPVEEWRTGLRRKFEQDECVAEESALDRLVDLGEGHPRATMLVSQQTHSAAVAAGTWAINAALVELGYRNALRAESPKHEQVVEHIRTLGGKGVQRLALKVARRIALGERVYGGDVSATHTNRAVRALRGAGIVDQERKRSPWYVVDPLFRRYLIDLDPLKNDS